MSLDIARNVLTIEAEGILSLIDRLDERFNKMVDLIYRSSGRVIVAGIGKSGIVGRKLVATLNSTGTRSFFLHPVEAMHGDLGMVGADDIFLALSNSGETDELNILLASIRGIGCPIIAFTGNDHSTLAKHSDITIDVAVPREACPLGLAPTASTTAQLAMADALAVVLLNRKRFNSSDFKRVHPGGSLGQRLARQVSQIMLTGPRIPQISIDADMVAAIAEINRLELGAVLIIDCHERLTGIITDGDLRRQLTNHGPDLFTRPIAEIMTAVPRTLHPESAAYDALNIMEAHEITILPIVDSHGKVCGILHLHDILGKGDFKFNGN